MIYYNSFKIGLKILFEKEPYLIEFSEYIKPGKGQVFTRVKLRNLLTGRLLDKTFRSTDHLKLANIKEINLCYLYNDNFFWYFMNKKNFDQFLVEKKILIKQLKWLVEQDSYMVTLWNNTIISLTLSNFVDLAVIKTEPGVKGDSVGTNEKIAVLSNGVSIKVPLFILVGEIIKVDTRSVSYVSRVIKK